MQNDVLATYLTMQIYQKDNKDLLDSLIPLIVSYLGKSNISLDINSIKDGLKDKFSLIIPEHTLSSVLTRMKKRNLIQSEEIRYNLSRSEKKGELSDLIKIPNLVDVLSVFKDYDKILKIEDLHNILKKSNININFKELGSICDRLRDISYLDLVDESFSLTLIGQELHSKLETESSVKQRLDSLFEDIRNHFKVNNKMDLSIGEIRDMVLYFTSKNIRPLIQFYRTQDYYPTDYVMKSNLDSMFCDYVIQKVRERDSVQSETLKEILIGSIISLTFKRELPIEEKNSLKGIEIYLDTNFLFHILGYGYPDLTRPTRELFERLKKFGFKLKIFDFTFEEAKGAIGDCISKYENIYIDNIRVNSICYYFKSAGKTLHDIRLIINNLEEIIKRNNISIEHTGINLIDYVIENDLILSLQELKFERPRNSILHDIAAIKKIKEIRGQNINKIEESKSIFLTVDERLFAFDFNKMGHKQNRVTIPEVFVDRLMTNILWLIDPKTEISLESLIAACIRDTGFLKPSQWDALHKIVNSLACNIDINHKDIINLLSGDNLDTICVSMRDYDENEKIILKKVEEGINKEIQEKETIIAEKDKQITKILTTIADKDKKLSDLSEELSKIRSLIELAEKEKNEKIEELKVFKIKYINSFKNKIIKASREFKLLEVQICLENSNRNEWYCKNVIKLIKIAISLLFLLYFGYGFYYKIDYIKNWVSYIPVIIFITILIPQIKLHEIWKILEFALFRLVSVHKKKLLLNYNESSNIEYIELKNVTPYLIDINGFIIEKLDGSFSKQIENNTDLNPKETRIIEINRNDFTHETNLIDECKNTLWNDNGFTMLLRNKKGRIVDSMVISNQISLSEIP